MENRNIIKITNNALKNEKKVKLCIDFFNEVIEDNIENDTSSYSNQFNIILNKSKYKSIKNELEKLIPTFYRFKKNGLKFDFSCNEKNELVINGGFNFNLDIMEGWKLRIMLSDGYLPKGYQIPSNLLQKFYNTIENDNELIEAFDIIMTIMNNIIAYDKKNIEQLVLDIKTIYSILTDKQKKTLNQKKEYHNKYKEVININEKITDRNLHLEEQSGKYKIYFQLFKDYYLTHKNPSNKAEILYSEFIKDIPDLKDYLYRKFIKNFYAQGYTLK